MSVIFIVREIRQQMVWLLELLVLSPTLGNIQLIFLFIILLVMMLLVNLILDFSKAF